MIRIQDKHLPFLTSCTWLSAFSFFSADSEALVVSSLLIFSSLTFSPVPSFSLFSPFSAAVTTVRTTSNSAYSFDIHSDLLKGNILSNVLCNVCAEIRIAHFFTCRAVGQLLASNKHLYTFLSRHSKISKCIWKRHIKCKNQQRLLLFL